MKWEQKRRRKKKKEKKGHLAVKHKRKRPKKKIERKKNSIYCTLHAEKANCCRSYLLGKHPTSVE